MTYIARDGKQLLDSRAPREQQAIAAELGKLEVPWSRLARSPSRATSRFDEVVELEAATQALRQLGYKTRAARRALAQARAHVGTDADVPTLVRAVLDLSRREAQPQCADEESTASLATHALARAGFSATLARHAVATACAHVGTEDLATLIKEALRHCRE